MKRNYALKGILAVFFVFAVIAPLISMLAGLRGVKVGEIILSGPFADALVHSIVSAGLATLFSVGLGLVLAWYMARSRIKGKAVYFMLLTLPMLIPSISHGMGLVMLLGQNGVVTNLLHLRGSIYGLAGIVTGSVIYSFPIAFLMFLDIFTYEDTSVYTSAEILGIPRSRQFLDITLPYLKEPFILITFTVFTMVVTDYGVPLMVGGKYTTLPVLMYQQVIGLLDFGKGSVIGTVLLVPAVITFLLDIFNREKGEQAFVTEKASPKKNRKRDVLGCLFCTAGAVLTTLPVLAFGLLTFVKKYPVDNSLTLENISRSMEMGAGRYLANSLLIAFLVSVTGTVLAYLAAYASARSTGKSSRALHLISITSLSLPGMVLGLSYAVFFKGTFLYGTVWILVLVNIVHFFASAYLLAYNSFGKMNRNLEAVGKMLGIGKMHLIKDVFLPQMKGTLCEMFSYFFVNSMITISAVSFLTTVKDMPLALMIPQYEAQMLLESSAFVSLLILAVNLAVKGILYAVKSGLFGRMIHLPRHLPGRS